MSGLRAVGLVEKGGGHVVTWSSAPSWSKHTLEHTKKGLIQPVVCTDFLKGRGERKEVLHRAHFDSQKDAKGPCTPDGNILRVNFYKILINFFFPTAF